MKGTILLTVVLLAFAGPAQAQGVLERARAMGSPWYLEGDPNRPCRIDPRFNPPGLVFINEMGETSRGRFLGPRRVVAEDWGWQGRAMTGSVEPDPIRSPDQVIRWDNGTTWSRNPNLSGTWYMWGDDHSPCEIRQRWPDSRAEFINEHGNRTGGTIQGNRVWIPDWSSQGRRGLEGKVRGDRIVWPDGSYWSR